MKDVCAVLRDGSSVAGRVAIDGVDVTPAGGARQTVAVDDIAWILFDARTDGAVEIVLSRDRRRLAGRLAAESFVVHSKDEASSTMILSDSLLALRFGALEDAVVTFKTPMTPVVQSAVDLCDFRRAHIKLVSDKKLRIKSLPDSALFELVDRTPMSGPATFGIIIRDKSNPGGGKKK